MTEPATSSDVSRNRSRWKWFLALGALLLVLGIAGVTVAGLLELTSLLVFGPMLLASSVIQLLTSFLADKGTERLRHFAAAGLEAVLGFVIMFHPPQSLGGIVALIAIFLIVSGLIRLARVLVARSPARAWSVMTGVVALLLGISVWIGWPFGKLWFVGICIAIDFICHGVSWSALALAERKPHSNVGPGVP
jgi:uncharacterized membrane protein HdeD (DUF308 family)